MSDLKIRWSKREKDFLIHYPRKCDGALIQSHILGENLHWGGIDGKDKEWLNFKTFSLLKELEERGYDLTTLKFEIKLKSE